MIFYCKFCLFIIFCLFTIIFDGKLCLFIIFYSNYFLFRSGFWKIISNFYFFFIVWSSMLRRYVFWWFWLRLLVILFEIGCRVVFSRGRKAVLRRGLGNLRYFFGYHKRTLIVAIFNIVFFLLLKVFIKFQGFLLFTFVHCITGASLYQIRHRNIIITTLLIALIVHIILGFRLSSYIIQLAL